MKTKYPLFLTVIVAVLTLIMLGQINHYVKTESIINKNDTSSVIVKLKDKNIKMDKVTKKALTSTKHYLLFDETNFTNEKEIIDTSIKVEVVPFSKKIFPIYSYPMTNKFSYGLLPDGNKGHLFTPNFNVSEHNKTMQFKYRVK